MLYWGDKTFLLDETSLFLVESFMKVFRENLSDEEMYNLVIDFVRQKYDCDEQTVRRDLIRVLSSVWKGESSIRNYCSVVDEIMAPRHLDLVLTYRCNNNCFFCYHGGSKISKEMSREELDILFGKIDNIGIVEINFTGGEPLLRFDVLKYLIDRYHDEFWMQITTNGRLLSSNKCKQLKNKGLQHIQIAMEHSSPFEHDAICGVSGAWEDTVRGIKNALDSGLSVATMTTLMKENKDCMDDLVYFLSDLGVKTILINSLFYNNVNSSRLTEVEMKETLQKMNCISKKDIKIRWLFPTCQKIFDPIKLGFDEYRRCTALTGSIAVEPNGNVIPCVCWFGESCGNIVSDDWSKIWSSETAKKIRSNKINKQQCARCEWIVRCNGSCPLEKICEEKV